MRVAQVLALVLLASSAATAAPKPDATLAFTAPAQLVGSVNLDDFQWAILIFDQASGASFDAGLEGVLSATNHTAVNLDNDQVSLIGRSSSSLPTVSQDVAHQANFNAEMAWHDVGSLVIIAESISVSMEARTELRPPDPNTTMEDYLPVQHFFKNAFRPYAYPISSSDVISTPNEISQRPVELQASGVRVLEWYAADVRCLADCLPGGGPSQVATVDAVRLNLLSYITVESSRGVLDGTAKVFAAAFGGTSMAAGVDGYGRFANANLTGRCGHKDCPNPDGQAFRANGTLQLQDIRLVEDGGGRMQAKFAGEIRAASFDESVVFPFSAKTVTIGALALLAAVAVAKAFFVLFTRHQRPALEDARVRELHDLIVREPGLSFADLRERTGTGNGGLKFRLDKLEGERLVVAQRYGNTLRFFENHGRYDRDWQSHAALKDDFNRLLFDWLTARPGSTQSQILDGVATSGKPRTSVQYSLRLLQDAGLLKTERDGRQTHYFAQSIGARKLGELQASDVPTSVPKPI